MICERDEGKKLKSNSPNYHLILRYLIPHISSTKKLAFFRTFRAVLLFKYQYGGPFPIYSEV